MAVVKNLLIRAGADFSELSKEMNKAKKYMKNAGKELTAIGKTLTLGITAPIVGMGVAAIKSASDLAEVQNVVDTVFGDSAESVNKWAKEAIKSYGLSELSAKEFAGTMRAMLGSMGLSSAEADNMSLSLSGLAGDMASFYNLDPTEAFEKLRSGIAGETEPLKALGINMSVANMEAYALSQGINKSWKEMTQAEQATLRYGYIMEATKNSHGDFAKTNTGLANSMRVMKEQFVSIGAQLGNILIPYIENFILKVRDILDVFMNLSPEMQKNILMIAGIAAAIGPVLLILGKLATGISTLMMWMSGISRACAAVSAGTKGVGAIFSAVFGPAGIIILVIAAIAALVAGFMYLWKNNEDFRNFIMTTWQAIVDFMTPILETIKTTVIQAWENIVAYATPIIENIKQIIIETWDKVVTKSIEIWEFLKELIIGAWDYIMSTAGPIIEQIKETISAAWEFIKELTKVVWDIIKDIFSGVFDFIKGLVTGFVSVVKYIWTNFGDIIIATCKNAWDMVVGVFKGVFKIIEGIFNIFTGILSGNWSKVWDGIKNVVTGVWDSIVSIVKGGINFLIGALNGFIRGINKIKVPDWIPGIGGKGINISQIPYLAKGTSYFSGGLAVVGEQGPELVSMPRGASVTPNRETESMLGGLNLNIANFYNNTDKDIEELAEQLAFMLKKKKMALGGV